MTVLVIGDAMADLCGEVARFPREGDDAPLGSLGWRSGGMGANVAAALARLGERSRLFARVGSDPAAEVALRVAREAGADLSAIQRDIELATGLCFAAVSKSGERTFFSHRGANAAFDLEQGPPKALGAALEGARWLHICGHALLTGRQRASALALSEAARARGVPVSLDLCAPLVRELREDTRSRIPRLSVLFANEIELRLLYPGRSEPDALDSLAALTARAGLTIAFKRGARGSVIIHAGGRLDAPPFPIDAIDTNGCGDAFVAGFLSASLRGDSIEERARLANALGALAATRRGAADSLPTREEVQTFLHEGARGARANSGGKSDQATNEGRETEGEAGPVEGLTSR